MRRPPLLGPTSSMGHFHFFNLNLAELSGGGPRKEGYKAAKSFKMVRCVLLGGTPHTFAPIISTVGPGADFFGTPTVTLRTRALLTQVHDTLKCKCGTTARVNVQLQKECRYKPQPEKSHQNSIELNT